MQFAIVFSGEAFLETKFFVSPDSLEMFAAAQYSS